MAAKKKGDLKQELIESILNENRRFDMSRWTTVIVDTKPASCETACCMAGWIQALRPKLAKELLPADAEVFGMSGWDHTNLARAIWEHETGQECRLDFAGENHPSETTDITRKDAVAHIRGRSKRWPLLDR